MSSGHSIPLYRKIYEILRKHIEEGLYKEGDMLPSENELCSVHGITRPTVRHTLDTLVNEGYIKKHKGKGSIVTPLPKKIGILSISGTTSALRKENFTTRIIVKPEIRPWEEPFMFPLSSQENESGCIYLERLRFLNNEPVFHDTNFIPNINLPRFTSRSLDNKSLFDTLREFYQVEVRGGVQNLRAIPANKKISRFFNVKQGEPILHVERKMHTNRDGFNIYSSIYCHTKKHSIYGTF